MLAFPFLDLPPELQIHVISHVLYQSQLYRLSQCSRILHALTLPYLYRDVEIRHSYQSSRVERSTCRLFRVMVDFTELILRKPDRARFVKSFTLSGEVCQHAHLIRQKVHDRIKEAIRQSQWSPADGEHQLVQIECGYSMEALIAVLLPSLPHLERLELIFHPECLGFIPFYDRMLVNVIDRRDNLPETAFGCLQHLIAPTFNHSRYVTADTVTKPGQGGIWPHQLGSFLELPSMRSIEGYLRVHDDGTSLPSLGDELDWLEPASSSVTSLVLESYGFDGKVIQSAVIACRSLKKLELRMLYKPSLRSDVAGLITAITQASQSLETLLLCYGSSENLWDYHIRRSTERDTISLVNFPNLRKVTIGAFFLFGGWPYQDLQLDEGRLGSEHGEILLQRLPAQIESLRVVLCGGEEVVPIFANVEAILWRKREGEFQRLASITVEYSEPLIWNIWRSQSLLGQYDNSKRDRINRTLDLMELASTVDVDFDTVHTGEYSPIYA